MMVGGYSNGAVDDDVRAVAESVRQAVEQGLGHSVAVYEVLAVKSQVVAGMNYRLKVRVTDTECVHIVVYKPLPYTRMPPSLSSMQTGKSLADPLE